MEQKIARPRQIEQYARRGGECRLPDYEAGAPSEEGRGTLK
jgi:hypothetical protein